MSLVKEKNSNKEREMSKKYDRLTKANFGVEYNLRYNIFDSAVTPMPRKKMLKMPNSKQIIERMKHLLGWYARS